MTATEIVWLPHDAGTGDDGEPGWLPAVPFTTFGTGSHAGGDGLVYVDDLTGPEIGPSGRRNSYGLDPEIADLVVALNKAGIETVQSCQEITDEAAEYLTDIPRMGIVVVTWAAFPKVAATLPGMVTGNNFDREAGSGWLFAAHLNAKYVSVIFPWRDHDAWLARLTSEGDLRSHPMPEA